MLARRTTYVRLLSLLIAGAATPSLMAACGGRAESVGESTGDGTSSGSNGTSDSDPKPNGSSGRPGIGSSGSSGTSGSSGGVSYGCANFRTEPGPTPIDATDCRPQLKQTTSCNDSVCSYIVEQPCAPGGDDAGSDAEPSDPSDQQLCLALCNAARPAGTQPASHCRTAVNADGGTTVHCGACGAGRPPRSFVAQHAHAPSDAAERLAQMAQLEEVSVYAFRALHADLARLRAPRHLLRAVLVAADDEVRHARAVRRAAERLGACVPEVRIAPARPRSLEELAIENIEEGCVNETFGAALAAMQAEHATDPGVRKMMRVIAREELGHAALSWQLAAWLDARLDAASRVRVAEARRNAVRSLEAGLATEDRGSALLGLPDAARAREALSTMKSALASGELALAA